MTKPTLLLFLLLSTKLCFSQTFLTSYRSYCKRKINSSILERNLRSSRIIDTSDMNKENNRLHKELRDRLDILIKKLAVVFNANLKTKKFDLNTADSLTIIYRTNNSSSFVDFIILSGKDTVESTKRLALAQEVNNGGGKLASLKKDATRFKVSKTLNNNMPKPFLQIVMKSCTANAFASSSESPVDIGNNSIIITAKRIRGTYRIQDYYLNGFSFVSTFPKI
jgi:hypothetical protein